MTAFAQVQGDAIRTRLLDWATVNFDTTRVWLPGEKFTQPAPDPASATSSSWVRLTIFADAANRLALSTVGKREVLGLATVDVFTPFGIGDDLARTYADSIAAYFRNQSESGVTYDEPLAHEVPLPDEEAEELYRWAVEIPFRQQFQPDENVVEVSYPVITYSPGSAHGLAAGNAVYLSGSTWTKAIATAEATLAAGVVVSVPSSTVAHISVGPTATVQSHGLGAAGTQLFLSRSTAGLLVTRAARDAEGRTDLYQLVATVIDANTLRLHDRPGMEI